MEQLERRIARLTPQQQDEVSDFVDFLILKNNMQQNAAASRSSVIMVNTPPVMVPDAVPHPFPLPRVSTGAPVVSSETPAPVILADESPAPVFEVSHKCDDGITREYMDYGRFEDEPGGRVADSTDKNARQKQPGRKEDREKTRHILEWVD